MSTFINNLQNVMTPELILYIGSALVVVIVLTIVLRGLKKRGLKSNLVDLERQYNEIKGIPLAFKFNKAVALSRVNEAMMAKVNECQPQFDSVQESLKECGVLLAEADDLLYFLCRPETEWQQGEDTGSHLPYISSSQKVLISLGVGTVRGLPESS